MSGLFDSLAARFAPGAQPAIRPRPQARFEGGADAVGLREEATQTVAKPAPQSPPRKSRSAPASPQQSASHVDMAQPTPARPSPPLPSHTQMDSRQPAPPPPEPHDGSHIAAEQDIPVRLNRTQGEQPPPPQRQRRTQAETPEPRPDTLGKLPATPSTSPERIIETRVQAEPPALKTDRLTDRPAHAVADAASAPAAASDPPVIRIGRIEVSRPPAPAPPPPAPAPARPQPPRRGGPVARSPAPSGLTDYLGWKKR